MSDDVFSQAAAGALAPPCVHDDRLVVPIDEYVKELAQMVNDLEFDHPEVDTTILRARLYDACKAQLEGERWFVKF